MDILHIDGKNNIVADFQGHCASSISMDFVQLAADQQSNPEVQAYRTAISSLKIVGVLFMRQELG